MMHNGRYVLHLLQKRHSLLSKSTEVWRGERFNGEERTLRGIPLLTQA